MGILEKAVRWWFGMDKPKYIDFYEFIKWDPELQKNFTGGLSTEDVSVKIRSLVDNGKIDPRDSVREMMREYGKLYEKAKQNNENATDSPFRFRKYIWPENE